MKKATVLVYLEASSKDDLIEEQLKNNMKHNAFFEYSTPQKDGKKWVTWYYLDILKLGNNERKKG